MQQNAASLRLYGCILRSNDSRLLAIDCAMRKMRSGVAGGGMRGGGWRNELIGGVGSILCVLALFGCGMTTAPSPGDTTVKINFKWVERENNSYTDGLSNKALDMKN